MSEQTALRTVDESCEALRISRGTFYAMKRSGEIRTVSIRSRTYVPDAEVQRVAKGEPLIRDGLSPSEVRAERARLAAELDARAAAKSARAREAGRAGGRPRKSTDGVSRATA